MPWVNVVAAIVFNHERDAVLLALRKPQQHQGDRWEFPGGKVGSGESHALALGRELSEEIGITPTRYALRSVIKHAYTDKQVRLHFYDVTAYDGEPQGREGQRLAWVDLQELENYRFPDANLPIVKALLRQENPFP